MKKLSIFILLISLLIFSSCSNSQNVDMKEKIVAVEADSLSQKAAVTIKSDVKEIKVISTADGAVSAVESKEADFVVLDEFTSALYIENKRKIEVVKALPFTTEFCAYFYENQDLLNKFNSIVFDMLEDGTITEIKDSYKQGELYYPNLTPLGDDAPVLTIGTDVVGHPYTDLTEDGSIIGIDIDIMSVVANKMGCNLEIVIAPVDEIFGLLKNGEVDLVVSGLMYDAEREESFDPSISYLLTEYYLHKRK